jgi:hypothetical protein
MQRRLLGDRKPVRMNSAAYTHRKRLRIMLVVIGAAVAIWALSRG